MVHKTLLAIVLYASTVAATPPGASMPQMPGQQPGPAAPAPLTAPSPTGAPTATPAPDPGMLANAKATFAQLQSGKVDRTKLTAEMNAALTDDKLATLKGAIGGFGVPTIFDQKTAGTTQAGVRYAVYSVVFSNGMKADFLFAVDAQGKIAGMRLTPAQ
jgi:hypothetical protein